MTIRRMFIIIYGSFVALLAVGFPAALVFSWVYELTPDGLKLEREVDREESITRETGKKIDRMTAVLAVVGVLIVIIDRLIVR